MSKKYPEKTITAFNAGFWAFLGFYASCEIFSTAALDRFVGKKLFFLDWLANTIEGFAQVILFLAVGLCIIPFLPFFIIWKLFIYLPYAYFNIRKSLK